MAGQTVLVCLPLLALFLDFFLERERERKSLFTEFVYWMKRYGTVWIPFLQHFNAPTRDITMLLALVRARTFALRTMTDGPAAKRLKLDGEDRGSALELLQAAGL